MSTATQTARPNSTRARRSDFDNQPKIAHRTTVTLSVEAAQIVERFKSATGSSTSRAIEELILRSEPQKSWLVEEDGLLVSHAPVKPGKLTAESVKQLLEECPF